MPFDMVRLALVVTGLGAWMGITAAAYLLGRRRRDRGRRGWPCVAGGAVTGLIVCYFIAGFAAM